MIVSKLTNEDDIIRWREAKTQADKDRHYRGQLGCVGEPIADAFDQVLRYIPCLDARADCQAILDAAAAEARGNLLDYANDAKQSGADEILSDLECVVHFDAYELEIDTSDTLAEVAEKGFDLALSAITGQCWNVTELTDEEL
jgi:hypothetical protein